MSAPLACIVCGMQPQAVFPADWAEPDEPEQPAKAVIFRSRGQYGSTVYDKGASSTKELTLNICDECLAAAGRAGRVLESEVIKFGHDVRSYHAWLHDPSDED